MALRGNDSALLLAALQGRPKQDNDAYAQAMMHQANAGVVKGLDDGSAQMFGDVLGQRTRRMEMDRALADAQMHAQTKQRELEAAAQKNAAEMANKLKLQGMEDSSREEQARILSQGRVAAVKAKPKPVGRGGGGAKSEALARYKAAIAEMNALKPAPGSFGANQREMMAKQEKFRNEVVKKVRDEALRLGATPEELDGEQAAPTPGAPRKTGDMFSPK